VKIHLHLGAHKTGTTYMQAALAANREPLAEAGVGFLPLTPFRNAITQNLMSLGPGEFSARKLIERFLPNGRQTGDGGIVMSDENLIGSPGELVRTGILYQNARLRSEQLQRILAGHEVALFFSVRSYDTYFASMYCEALRHSKEFIRFVDFRARINNERSRWPVVLEEILAGMQPSDVYLWRYEDFRPNAAQIIRRLAFGRDAPADGGGAERLSFSQTAVDVLTMIADRHGAATAGQLVNTFSDKLPKGAEFETFDPWTDRQRRELTVAYEEDCAAIGARLVRFDR
jgi:hypothetical protein